jgi:hypothetical protein
LPFFLSTKRETHFIKGRDHLDFGQNIFYFMLIFQISKIENPNSQFNMIFMLKSNWRSEFTFLFLFLLFLAFVQILVLLNYSDNHQINEF